MRIDSGDLGVLARQVREQLDRLGATATRIVVSGDLDEFAIAALRAEPVDFYGVGTSVVTGSGAPTAGMVYKLVEVDGIRGRKTQHPQGISRRTQAGATDSPKRRAPSSKRWCIPRAAHRRCRPDLDRRDLTIPLVRDGEPVADLGLDRARALVGEGLHSLPWDGLSLSHGDPAIPTRMIAPARGPR